MSDSGQSSPAARQARALMAAGRIGEAVETFRRALQITPSDIDLWSECGSALFMMGRAGEALACFDRMITLAPENMFGWNNRAVALRALGQLEDALEACIHAIALAPDFAEALGNRALILKELGRLDDAFAAYDTALARAPGNPNAWNSKGALLQELGRFPEALEAYSKAIELAPGYVNARNNRGLLLWSRFRRYEEAIADLEHGLGADYAPGEFLHIRMQAGDWRDYARIKSVIDRGVREGRRVARPFAYQGFSDSPTDQQRCAQIFAGTFPSRPGPAVKAGPRERLRIGYVAADFREQATAFLTAGLYEHHDRTRFEVVAFDNGFDDASPMRRRLEAAFDRFHIIAGMSDTDAAELVRSEKIDILVNLNGWFGEPRMGLFAARPAPVQVNYLGFPGTLGASYIDYILADPIVIPGPERRFYSEQVVWLPDCYQANDDRRDISPTTSNRAAEGLPEQGFVFCNFNQSYKLTPDIFSAWMRLLKQTPGSVLWLLDGVEALRTNLRRTAQAQGVSDERLVFAPTIPLPQHLARLRLADLFIDSLPYNAHTTASDALWAGVPLVTCRGHGFAGRVAASLLSAAGLADLITENLAAYEALALGLAHDPERLAALRTRVHAARTSPLFDTARFTRNLETAYRRMWDIASRGEPPRAFAVNEMASGPQN